MSALLRPISVLVLLCLLAPMAAQPVAARAHLRARLAEKMGLPETAPASSAPLAKVDVEHSYREGRAAAKGYFPYKWMAAGFFIGVVIPGVSIPIVVGFADGKEQYHSPDHVLTGSYCEGYYRATKRREKWGAFAGGVLGAVVFGIVVYNNGI